MVFLPWNLIDADGFQEIDDVLATEIMGGAVGILRHEDDRHIGEEIGYFLSESRGPGRVLGHEGLNGDDGEGHALLNNDCSVNSHGESFSLCVDENPVSRAETVANSQAGAR